MRDPVCGCELTRADLEYDRRLVAEHLAQLDGRDLGPAEVLWRECLESRERAIAETLREEGASDG